MGVSVLHTRSGTIHLHSRKYGNGIITLIIAAKSACVRRYADFLSGPLIAPTFCLMWFARERGGFTTELFGESSCERWSYVDGYCDSEA